MKRSPLIAAEEVDADVRLLDARSGPDANAAYVESHLAGAVWLDLERDLCGDVSHPQRGGRHPLPTLDAWARTLGRLGVDPETAIVVYDDVGGANAAARAWWMLRAVGHESVAVLDGGLAAALAAGLPLAAGSVTPPPAERYPVGDDWQLPTVSADEVRLALADPTMKVLDVRAAYRYRGESEPIDPVAGHIPGALNLFFGDNLGPDGRFRRPETLREAYGALLDGIPPERLIVHCGSGVTACHTLLALEVAGLAGARLYVGSWGEWCRSGRPIAPHSQGKESEQP